MHTNEHKYTQTLEVLVTRPQANGMTHRPIGPGCNSA